MKSSDRRWRLWLRAIGFGATRRCPRCGGGELFERWNHVLPTCSVCGLRYLLNQGDPWAFLLVLDRVVFIFPPIVIIYFGLAAGSVTGTATLFALLVGSLIYTTPHRYGICIALDWLTRPEDDPGPIRYPSTCSSSAESD
jgi:uncharacterized protein (DUF983 family)